MSEPKVITVISPDAATITITTFYQPKFYYEVQVVLGEYKGVRKAGGALEAWRYAVSEVRIARRTAAISGQFSNGAWG